MKHIINDNEWLLLVKYLNNECSDSERLTFESWLDGFDRNGLPNRELFDKVRRDLSILDSERSTFHSNPEEVWLSIENHIDADKSAGKIRFYQSRLIKYAAAILLLITVSAVLLYHSGQFSSEGKISLYTSSSDKEGSFQELSDGSKVWLARNSTLGYSEFSSQKIRLTSLEGEAYFEIERDEDKPFVIKIGPTTVKVLGTAFNIKHTKDQKETVVSVTNGRVLFTDNNNQSVELIKGEEGVFHPENNTIIKNSISNINFLSWKTGIIIFQDFNLTTVCEFLSNHFDTKVEFTSNISDQVKLNVSFDNQSIEEILTIISETLDLKVDETESGFLLSNK